LSHEKFTECLNDIKRVAKKIEVADAELIANAPDISPDGAEIIKQMPTHSFTDNMALQRHYLWKIYAYDTRNWLNYAIKALENLKIKEAVQWEESRFSGENSFR